MQQFQALISANPVMFVNGVVAGADILDFPDRSTALVFRQSWPVAKAAKDFGVRDDIEGRRTKGQGRNEAASQRSDQKFNPFGPMRPQILLQELRQSFALPCAIPEEN